MASVEERKLPSQRSPSSTDIPSTHQKHQEENVEAASTIPTTEADITDNNSSDITTTATSSAIEVTSTIKHEPEQDNSMAIDEVASLAPPKSDSDDSGEIPAKASASSEKQKDSSPQKSEKPKQNSSPSFTGVIPHEPSVSSSSNPPRRLPPRGTTTKENIAEQYIEFIFYCNPTASLDTDLSALQRAFNAVPKSDGKTFEPWHLYQLVGKHESGEIRTWTKLAQQLGVERTDESSPQKIQQYAVRLKKWMRSIHLDAFFDYLLAKQNDYYQEPHKNPTGLEEPVDDDAEENDLVLKLIRRANSKRKKRKYTRRNPSNDPDGGKNDDANSGDHKKKRRDDRHQEKRRKVTFSEGSSEGSAGREEDDDNETWDDNDMDVDKDDPDSSMHTARKRSIVQHGAGTRWIKEEDNEYTYESGTSVPKNKDNSKKASSSKSSRKHSRRNNSDTPAQDFLLTLKNSDHIPTPTPSPTKFPEMKHHSSGNFETGNNQNGFRHSNNIRWRSISVGGGPTSSLAPSSSSSSSSQKGSKRKQSADTSSSAHYDTFRVQQQQPPYPQNNVRPEPPPYSTWPSTTTTGNDDKKPSSFAELLLPSMSSPQETHDRLVKAVGMLEESHRKIEQLECAVRQREEEIRRKVINEMKDDMMGLFRRWEV